MRNNDYIMRNGQPEADASTSDVFCKFVAIHWPAFFLAVNRILSFFARLYKSNRMSHFLITIHFRINFTGKILLFLLR